MLYAIARVDGSGRVASLGIIAALGWRPGDGIEVTDTSRAIVMQRTPGGLVALPHRPCVVIPTTIRRRRGIKTGDHVLLAAAPDQGLVLVHTLADVDDMLSGYHASQPVASRP